MPIDLTSLRHKPTRKTFHYAWTAVGLERTEDPAKAVLSLDLEYMSRTEHARFLAASTSERTRRKVISKHGLKGLLSEQDAVARDLVFRVLKGWKLTVKGATLLNAECDFSALKPTELIEFNDENVAFMVEHSHLAGYVDSLITDYDSWFDMNQDDDEEEDSSKNSPSGPGGSTDGSPAEPASSSTSTPTS